METAKDIITSLAALAAVIIGFLGLKTWKLQLKATYNTELARRILISLYKVKSAISVIRRPFREVSLPDGESRFDDAVTNEAFASQYQNEWALLSNQMAELEAIAVEAQAVWDSQFPMILVELRICIAELQEHISEYLRSRRDPTYETYIDRKKMRHVLYGIGGDRDVFGQQVDEAVRTIDMTVRRHFIN